MTGKDVGSANYEIKLMGRLQLIGPDSAEIQINRAKVQALLALLASEPGLTRSRAWLQDKLWSTAGPGKGANSLRQTLHHLRAVFGDNADIVRANRSAVSLCAKRVRVDTEGHGDFLEGLDVGDPEFEHWLSDERVRRGGAPVPPRRKQTMPVPPAPPAPPPTRPTRTKRGLALQCTNDPTSRLGQFELYFADIVRKSIREVLDFEAVDPDTPQASATDVITLGIQAHHAPQGDVALRLAVHQGATTAAVWADNAQGGFPAPAHPLPPEFLNLGCRVSAVLTTKLSETGSGLAMQDDANFFAGAGIRHMYSMLPGSIEQAGHFFTQAEDRQTRGLFYALRAQLAVIDFVESGGANRETLRDMADDYCAKALHMEGTNSVVLAAVAHARLVFENDATAAGELARLGVLSNSGNPVAWSAWANVLLNAGKLEDAAQAARMALNLSKDTYYRYWTEFQYATTAVALNKTQDAIAHSERARALNPRYRPAMRYLIGLYSNAEDFVSAKSALERLQRQESTLTLDQLIQDDKYPVSMMRKAGLIDPSKLGQLD